MDLVCFLYCWVLGTSISNASSWGAHHCLISLLPHQWPSLQYGILSYICGQMRVSNNLVSPYLSHCLFVLLLLETPNFLNSDCFSSPQHSDLWINCAPQFSSCGYSSSQYYLLLFFFFCLTFVLSLVLSPKLLLEARLSLHSRLALAHPSLHRGCFWKAFFSFLLCFSGLQLIMLPREKASIWIH